MSVYLVRELHFSPLQLVLMGTAMEAAVFLCEVPTGVVADTYSRRLSLIIGYLGMGVAWARGRARLGAVADHRPLGALGPLVHLHERGRAGVDHGRGRLRERRQRLPARRALRPGRRGARAARTGRRRSGLAPRGRDPRRRLHDRLRPRLPRLHARARLPPAAARGAGLGARGDADDRHRGRALRLGGAGDPAPDRGRAVRRRLERGVRPPEGGALPARHRPSRATSTRWSGSGSSGSRGWC